MLQLRTFGGLSLTAGDGGAAGRGAQRRRMALLAVLAVQRHRPVSRDKLLGLFWPDRPSAEGRHSLAQLIYAIRHEFGDAVLVSGADDLRTDPAGVSADVIDFELCHDRGDLEAARCYTGPFLDGFYLNDAPEFEHWVDVVRADLALRYGTTLDALARAAGNAGHATEAGLWWRKRLALDPLNAGTTVDLMRALAAAGDTPGALRQAGLHQALRQAELDAGPDARVAAAAEALRDADLAAEPTPAAVAQDAAPPDGRPVAMPRTPPRRLRVPARWIAGAILVLALAAGGLSQHRHISAGPPGMPRLVVLGAIEGPDSNLALAVHEALRSGLEADSTIRVVGEARVHETLRLMARPADTRLVEPVATEIALRNGAAFAVVGTVVPVGVGLQVVVRAVNPRSGQARLTMSERAATGSDVIPALARIREGIRREAVGATRDAVLEPLPPVMTSSLAALLDYALAREALRKFDRPRALRLAEAALGEDSMFPMANYLVGDLDWFNDHQRAAELHLTRALFQTNRLPLRERLLVEARYEELVADQSDSALVLWQRLRDAFPGDGQAYEGMAWTYRALGRYAEAAAAADTALQLDSTTFAPSASNEVYALIDVGDTTRARMFIRQHRAGMFLVFGSQVEFYAALRARDWPRVLRAFPDPADSASDPYHHLALLVNGRFGEAASTLKRIREVLPRHQFLPRAISLQARAELAQGAPSHDVRRSAREVLTWLETADLSAAATARLAERAAELAARVNDAATIAAARRLLERRDAGHGRPSIRLALCTVDAAAAMVRGDFRNAARLALAARARMFHGRSLALPALLEADARAALGDTAAAGALYTRLLTPNAFAAGDTETWAVLVPEVARKLRQLGVVAVSPAPQRGSDRSRRVRALPAAR